MTFPQHNQVVRFSKVPAGSYCSEGVDYRVDRPKNKGDFRFERVTTGSATVDRPWAVQCAKWEVVA